MECIWIWKQKVVLFIKFKENQREAAVNALNTSNHFPIHISFLKYRENLQKKKKKNPQNVTCNSFPKHWE
jgi:hypothetical protein